MRGKMVSANDPSMTIPHTNRLLGQVGDQLEGQHQTLSQLVELAQLERQARLSAEATARRWRWATFALGVLTLVAAVVGALAAL
jgi:hypothetical protein